MLRLRVLGRVELTASDGTPSSTVAAQPKLLALLTYLALAQRPVRRDTLLGLLWPELDAAAGRHALSQVLSVLRTELGPAALHGKWRESLVLDSGAVWCDATALRAAVSAGEHATALELYGGPLLNGVFVPQAAEFERWLEDERRALQRLAAHSALTLAAGAARAGRWLEGGRWAERAIALDPWDEAAWRALFSCRDGAGDRAGALAAFQQLVRRLRVDLDVEPAPETVALIESIRRRAAPATTVDQEKSRERDAVVAAGSETPSLRAVPSRRRLLRGQLVALGLVCSAAIIGFRTMAARRAPASAALDSAAIAVLPFRTIAADTALAGLGTGILELLAIRLNAMEGVRAVDQRTLLFQVNRVARDGAADLPLDSTLAVAARAGAGRVLTGSIVAMPGGVTLSAALHDVPGGRVRGRAHVQGPADSIMPLIDRLAAQVLGLAAGEDETRLAELATASPAALRAYLAGRLSYRAGDYPRALRHFDHALDIDTTFALAAMGVLASASWVGQLAPGAAARADRRAWDSRERLGHRDRLRLLAFLGHGRPGASTVRGQIAFIEHALTRIPDDPELWYELGEQLLHGAPLAGIADWHALATAAFQHALRLDSTHVPSLIHLVHLAAEVNDSAAVRRLTDTYRARAPGGHEAQAFRWLSRVLNGASMPRGELDGFDDDALLLIVRLGLSYGVGLADVERALELARERAVSAPERARVARWTVLVAQARGQPERAQQARREWLRAEPDPWTRRGILRGAIFAALYGHGSAADADAAAGELARMDGPGSQPSPGNVCPLALWQVARGETADPRSAFARLRSVQAPHNEVWQVREAEVCAALLEVLLAERTAGGVTGEQLVAFDSLLGEHLLIRQVAPPPVLRLANLVSARLREARGEYDAAFAALARRFHTIDAIDNPPLLVREECRIAIRAGRHDHAQRSCARLLALRADAEPGLRADAQALGIMAR